jgi:hypothetical protein
VDERTKSIIVMMLVQWEREENNSSNDAGAVGVRKNNDDGARRKKLIIIKYYYYQVMVRLAVRAGRALRYYYNWWKILGWGSRTREVLLVVLFREDSLDWGYWRDGNTCSTSTG